MHQAPEKPIPIHHPLAEASPPSCNQWPGVLQAHEQPSTGPQGGWRRSRGPLASGWPAWANRSISRTASLRPLIQLWKKTPETAASATSAIATDRRNPASADGPAMAIPPRRGGGCGAEHPPPALQTQCAVSVQATYERAMAAAARCPTGRADAEWPLRPPARAGRCASVAQ